VYAFSEFTINAAPEDPEVTFRLLGVENGSTLCEKKLKRSELTPLAQKRENGQAQGSGPTGSLSRSIAMTSSASD
jgi:hypothetical protein